MAIIPCSINKTNFVWSFIWNLPATLHHLATFNHNMMCDSANMTCQPMAHPLVLHLHHPSLSPPHPLTPLSSHKPCCRQYTDHLGFTSCATRVHRLDSCHSNITQHAPHHPFALYIAAWVCPLSCLVFACIWLSTGHWPTVNWANGPHSSSFFCNLYVPHSFVVPYLHRLYYVLSASWVLLGGRPHSYMQTATIGPSFHTTTMHPNLPQTPTLHISEHILTMSKLFVALASGTLHEVFCIGMEPSSPPCTSDGSVALATAVLVWRLLASCRLCL